MLKMIDHIKMRKLKDLLHQKLQEFEEIASESIELATAYFLKSDKNIFVQMAIDILPTLVKSTRCHCFSIKRISVMKEILIEFFHQ